MWYADLLWMFVNNIQPNTANPRGCSALEFMWSWSITILTSDSQKSPPPPNPQTSPHNWVFLIYLGNDLCNHKGTSTPGKAVKNASRAH
jgi:hypothetical protein